MKSVMRFARFFTLAVLLLSPLAVQAQREKLPPEDLAVVRKNWPEAQRTSTGLRTQLISPGQGPKPQKGQLISVLYSGRLLDGNVFDENWDRENPFVFRLGRNFVIDGWEEGLQMMQVGEKRLFIIPYELAYGTRGDPPKIPRRATLVFEVELLAIMPEPEPGAAK
jgi:FKBP-type peptidyl-prolyl cis-trans isomerase